MSLIVYGALIAAYAYYVWLLGRVAWGAPRGKSRVPARVLRMPVRPTMGQDGRDVDGTGRRTAGGSRG